MTRTPLVSRARQTGATLLVTLVLMLLVGVVAVSSLGGSERNLRVAGNMQMRNEALAAAQALIEQTISSAAFTRDPAAVAALPYEIDVDGDARADYEVRLDPIPSCLRVRPVKTAELDATVPGDVACLGSSGLQSGRDYGATGGGGDSLCHETLWNIGSSVSDAITGSQVRVHQGVTVRIPVTDVENACG
jgi:hypothetical protein